MSAMQFLSGLPALLGLTGFVVYFFLLRNRGGDRVTLDIVAKLRRDAPDRIPAGAEKLDAATLTKLIEDDAKLRASVSGQDFELLREALRQQFVTSNLVYVVCGLIFLVGVALFVYMTVRPQPLVVSSIAAESAEEIAKGLAVDVDRLQVRWFASGDPEDVTVALEDMDSQRRTSTKVVRSTEGRVIFAPGEYRPILTNRHHGDQNRLRVIVQTAKAVYPSAEFSMHVGLTILAVRLEPEKLKIVAQIDSRVVDFYDFEAKLLIWASAPGQPAAPQSYGGQIKYGDSYILLDKKLAYDWGTTKLFYLGPDDARLVRTALLGF